MGCFSWKTQDTDKSISSRYSNRSTFTVTMLDNKGNSWVEDNYEGYGEFGGKDYYELLAEMNGIENADRQDGIDLAFDNKPFISPNLVENKIGWDYITNEPESCESQGFFYDDYRR